MATMNVSLPDEMKKWVEEQTKDGTYANASDVVRDALRRAQRRERAIAHLNAEIQKGIDSGIVENYDPIARRARLRSEFLERQSKSTVDG